MRFRDVDDADLLRIRDIYNHYVRTSTVTFDEDQADEEYWAHRKAELAARGLPFLVAVDDDGALLGYAFAKPWSPKSAYRFTVENSIYLAPEAAGRGVGSALLAAFVDACRAAGLRTVIAVIADRGAEASIALHRRAGFVDVGVLPEVGEKFGEALGVTLMRLALAGPASAATERPASAG